MARIGFVGLGQMGGGMSRNLIKHGHRLRVFDLSEEQVAGLVADGAEAAPSAGDAARDAEVVFTVLPIGANVEAAVFGENGIADAISADAVYVDMSTILPDETRAIGERLERQRIAMVDAPVGRTSAHAAAGTSTFMVGGADEDVARVRPYLECMGESITHCGPLGAGATVKLINNYISAVCNLVTAEGITLGLAAGIDTQTIVEVISQTPAGQGHIKTTWPGKALVDDASPAFMLDLARKDLGLALSAGAAAKVPMLTGAAAREVYTIASAQGRGRDDWTTGVFRAVKELAKVS